MSAGRPATSAATLWGHRELARLAAVNVAGVVLSGIGWWMASGKGEVRLQLPGAMTCLVGAVVVFASHLVWISRGRRAVARRAGPLLEVLDVLAAAGAQLAALDPGWPVAGERLAYYHQRGCPLVTGRAFEAAPPAVHQGAGRRPCAVCRP